MHNTVPYRGHKPSNKPSHPLRFFYHNCGGMRGKLKNLFVDINSCLFDILVITETWLNDSYTDAEIAGSDWTIYRRDRDYVSTNLTRGGGVLIAVRNSLVHDIVITEPIIACEHNFIKIRLHNRYIFVGVVYIPPNSNDIVYNEFFESYYSINSTLNEFDSILVFGDFNRPNLSFILDESDKCLLPANLSNDIDFALVDTFYGNDLQQIVESPNKNGNWLDLIFCNSYNETIVKPAKDDENLFSNTIHHTAYVVELQTVESSFTKSYNNKIVYDFKNSDVYGINNALTATRWPELFQSLDLDSTVSSFYSCIFEIIDAYIPKIIKKDKLTEPWLDSDLRALRNRRNKLYKIIKQSNNSSPEIINEHKELSIRFISSARTAYDAYINKLSQDLITKPKKFFDFINLKRKCSGYPSTMFKDNISSTSPRLICDLFADRFSECYRLSTDSTVSYTHTTNEMLQLISKDEIYIELTNIDLNKSPGPDQIPPIFLHNFAQHLSEPLYYIFNKSLSSGTFPSAWKSSYLIPIHKNGNKSNVDNYRGIALLSIIPKLFEKIICDKISPLINPLLNEEQHGFRKGRSTTTNLMVFTSSLLCNMDKGHQIDVVYTDFSKAFDRVNHDILISKLKMIGIENWLLNWLSSYLTQRTQQVKFQGFLSKEITVPSGVPQGSHLGPLLFNILIRDLSECLSDIPHLLYADDLKIFKVMTNVTDYQLLESKLQSLMGWCTHNKLDLNVDKCHVISFSRRKSVTLHDYHLNGTSLQRVNRINDLGVLLDTKLNFTLHFDSITSRANKLLGFIKRRAAEFKNVWATKSLYCALVRPILEYASPVWDPNYQTHRDRIESIQKKFLLFALRDLYDPNDYNTLPSYKIRLKLMDIDSLSSRRALLASCFTFDVLSKNIDVPYISERINFNNDRRQTRHTPLLKITSHRTDYAKYEPINKCCMTFNKFSTHFSPSITKIKFKKDIRNTFN